MTIKTLPTLIGTNIRLRKAEAKDAATRLALGCDPHIFEMFGTSHDQIEPMTEERALRWVQNIINHPYAWVIEHETMIGKAQLERVDVQDRRASLIIAILDPLSLGKGYGTEATKLLLAYAFNQLKLHRITLRVLAYNERAVRAYQKCGFRIEGRERESGYINGKWHDDIIMGVLAHEFLSLDSIAN